MHHFKWYTISNTQRTNTQNKSNTEDHHNPAANPRNQLVAKELINALAVQIPHLQHSNTPFALMWLEQQLTEKQPSCFSTEWKISKRTDTHQNTAYALITNTYWTMRKASSNKKDDFHSLRHIKELEHNWQALMNPWMKAIVHRDDWKRRAATNRLYKSRPSWKIKKLLNRDSREIIL